jgi:hypothetical protein
MWTFLERFVSRLRREPVTVTIGADDERVVAAISNREHPISFSWRDVEEIETYKRDLFSSDEIYLSFGVTDAWYEFSESDAGFQQLAELMQAKFPSIPECWYGEVMQPPFATNQRTLWTTPKTGGESSGRDP